MRRQPHIRRNFLFLQGPHGSFFPKLGQALEQAGHEVRRINFNGGDRATWPSGDSFGGRESAWPRFVGAFISRHRITDLVLFGDSRPRHADAIRQAQASGVQVHVFEEGYVRPDWVTLEREGVNGHSTLPRDPDWYLKAAEYLPPVPSYPSIPSYATARGWAAFFYYAEAVLQHWRFPFHWSHRDRNPVWEGITYLRRFRRRAAEDTRCRTEIEKLAGRPFFLFPLQLNSDYQIRVHSDFGSMHAAIRMVFESFARHSPADTALVVKEHPLDSGLVDWRHFCGAVADEYGMNDRLVFLEHGDLLALVRGMLGMVTINSTSGTLALAAGKPVKVLGDAVYDIDRITDQAPIDAFWANPGAPDPACWDSFYRVVHDRCLLHGAFLSNAGIDLLVKVATERLMATDTAELSTAGFRRP